jgi:hypothetical protein
MNEPDNRRKTFEVPQAADEPQDRVPAFSFNGELRDGRDTSKPIAYDEHGRALYAPKGIRLQ